MEGVSIIESAILHELISKIEAIDKRLQSLDQEAREARKPYLTVQEVMQLTGFSLDWVNDHRGDIGFSNIGRTIRFKRKDVEAYMQQEYYKNKTPRRKYT